MKKDENRQSKKDDHNGQQTEQVLTMYEKVQNAAFYLAIGFVGYALVRIYYDRWQAPDGVCPVNKYSLFINIGVTCAAIYFLMGAGVWLKSKFVKDNPK